MKDLLSLMSVKFDLMTLSVHYYNSETTENFKLALKNASWWTGNLFDDIDDVVNTWEFLYKDVVDEFITVS